MAEFDNSKDKNKFDDTQIFCRDYIESLPQLYALAQKYSDGKWNKFEDDTGDAMIKMLASSMHIIDFYYHRYIDALVLPNNNWKQKSLIWELTGYKPPYIRADYLMVQLYWPGCVNTAYVPIYQYTKFKVTHHGKDYTFMAAKDYLLPPMTSKANITLVQGELVTLKPSQNDLQKINNHIKLSDTPIDYDLVTVFVSDKKFRQVRNVYYEFDTSCTYSLHREEDGIYLYFPDDWEKDLDEYNQKIEIYFISSDGDETGYTEDCLDITIDDVIMDTNGINVSDSYRIFPMPQKEIETSIVPALSDEDRCVTTDDYTNKALLYPGVATAHAYSWNTPDACTTPFEVVIYALGPNGLLLDRIKDSLGKYLEEIGPGNISVKVYDPIFMPYNLSIITDIGDYIGTLSEMEINLKIRQALKEMFAYGKFRPGDTITGNEIASKLLRVDERIMYVQCEIRPTPPIGPAYVPVLGSLSSDAQAKTLSVADYIMDGYTSEEYTTAYEYAGISIFIEGHETLYSEPRNIFDWETNESHTEAPNWIEHGWMEPGNFAYRIIETGHEKLNPDGTLPPDTIVYNIRTFIEKNDYRNECVPVYESLNVISEREFEQDVIKPKELAEVEKIDIPLERSEYNSDGE